jgi:hypothetical protein
MLLSAICKNVLLHNICFCVCTLASFYTYMLHWFVYFHSAELVECVTFLHTAGNNIMTSLRTTLNNVRKLN